MRTAIGWLLRLYSYLFHLILSLFLIGISIVALSSHKALLLRMLPWEGEKLNDWTLGIGILGLIFVFLAVTGIVRWIFPLWTLLAFGLMLRGFFLTNYDFGGEANFKSALWLTFAAFVAFLGSLFAFGAGRRKAR